MTLTRARTCPVLRHVAVDVIRRHLGTAGHDSVTTSPRTTARRLAVRGKTPRRLGMGEAGGTRMMTVRLHPEETLDRTIVIATGTTAGMAIAAMGGTGRLRRAGHTLLHRLNERRRLLAVLTGIAIVTTTATASSAPACLGVTIPRLFRVTEGGKATRVCGAARRCLRLGMPMTGATRTRAKRGTERGRGGGIAMMRARTTAGAAGGVSTWRLRVCYDVMRLVMVWIP